MKKKILILLLCVTGACASLPAGAATLEVVTKYETTEETAVETEAETKVPEVIETPEETGFAIVVNGVTLKSTSLLREEIHYLPLRAVFEKAGARVYFRSRDSRVLVLTRDGNMIEHVVGTNVISVNGETKTCSIPSVSENYTTHLPLDMLTAAFRANAVLVENEQIKISAPIPNTDYGKAVNDALYAGTYSNFFPEKFRRYINYHIQKPDFTMQAVVFTVNLGLDFPFYQNVSVIANPYDRMVLVNKYNRLPSGFQQTNLVSMDRGYTVSDGKQYLMESTAYASFVRMADAARKDGVSIRAVSTYRTEAYQNNLYNKKTRTLGKNADDYSARPGFSEHQTGLAVDINSTKTSFEKTSVFAWLQKHAHEYGFILRYSKGQKWITGYEYEPWHYRYVGVEAATEIRNEGTTYEQYYAKYIAVSEYQ